MSNFIFYEAQQSQANALQTLINIIDKKIDKMVYEPYRLTEEEVKIVERGVMDMNVVPNNSFFPTFIQQKRYKIAFFRNSCTLIVPFIF